MKKIKVGALISSLLTILTMSVQAQKIYDVDVEVRENSIVINNTALDMIEDERHASAVKILESVLEDDPSFHPAYLNYYRAGRNVDEKVEKVVNVLKKGLEIFEEDDEMAYYLGNLLQKEQRFDEAILAYTDAINYSKINGEDFPLVWAYYFNRGNCYLKTNQYKKAIPDYDYGLTLSPDNYDILTNRGYAYFRTDKKEAACKDWKTALELGSTVTEKYLQSYCK
ncbi:tetratricopeptide repeat protein [Mongoliibacter ruber]|uniref:Tetratricopeptide repeat protein n=1 Tax=Mongoliibacter ruber TaxID=1750599 RepID=A0A2T0WUP5_9BACT|nr:tetratricopeptide repeat protein [Mongoliibacter ruber]PRY90426.1 tetratricopeptide repeat protein [Mongoliibacter ruber]